MEESRMIDLTNVEIKEPEFVDLQKTRMRFKVVQENGLVTTAELAVPANFARGENAYFDKILDNFDIQTLRKARNDLEIRRRREAEFLDKKKKSAIENEKLRRLFDLKMKAFDMFFIAEADTETKAALRRAPDEYMINAIVQSQIQKYITDNNMTYGDLIDKIEDLAEEAELAAAESAAQPTTEETTPTQ